MSGAAFRIGPERMVGPDQAALIVAEIGQNHNGQQAMAEQLIDAASWAGADAIKLVKRDLDSELSRAARSRQYHGPHAFGDTYEQHRRALELSAESHVELVHRARQRGLLYLATVGDLPSLELAQSLGADALKIASRDCGSLPLIEEVASRGRPVFLSTGMSDLDEIDRAVEVLEKQRAAYVLLQCTSLYPAPFEEAHLCSMPTLRERYGALVGYSDHTSGSLLPPVAVAMGAVVIEKHLTLDRGLRGSDHACSLEPDEFFHLVNDIRQVEQAQGRDDKPVPSAVRDVKAKLGRSLVARQSLAGGTRLEETMVTLKCPGDGMSWHELGRIVGRRLKRDVSADEQIVLEDFD
jgi:sialic acid synthase SpsE